jgi:hypothetical protein
VIRHRGRRSWNGLGNRSRGNKHREGGQSFDHAGIVQEWLNIYKILLRRVFRNDVAKLAERGGFEPPVPFYRYNGLANRPFRPLRHLSEQKGSSNRERALGARRFEAL